MGQWEHPGNPATMGDPQVGGGQAGERPWKAMFAAEITFSIFCLSLQPQAPVARLSSFFWTADICLIFSHSRQAGRLRAVTVCALWGNDPQ